MSGATSSPAAPDGFGGVEGHEESLLRRPWWSRAVSAIEVGARRGTGVPLGELLALLPDDGPSSEEELARWIADALPEAVLLDGVVYGPSTPPSSRIGAVERSERAERWIRAAEELVNARLGAARGLLCSVAVTGSAAYGQVLPDDDCDLLVVTSDGAVWTFLALAFAHLRRQHAPDGLERIRWCLNYVVDLGRARQEYRRGRGFQFAREALTARAVYGAAEYAALLREGSWMAEEMPRLYARRRRSAPPEPKPGPKAPWLARLLNPVLFLPLAGYLQAAGLLRNWRLRREGHAEKAFTTTTSRRMLTYESRAFRELAEIYGAPPVEGDRVDPDDF